MQLREIKAFIFILVVWSVVASAPYTDLKKYDPSSIDQTQRILRLLLRLSYHTANRLIRLKSEARLRAENVVDKDLQNITMKEIMQGMSKNVVKPTKTQIQSRFFGFEPQTLLRAMDPLKNIKPSEALETMTNIPKNMAGLINENLENKKPKNIISPITQVQDLQKISTKTAEIMNKTTVPVSSLLRILPTKNQESNTTINRTTPYPTTPISIINGSQLLGTTIIKGLDTASVPSVFLIYSVGNFSASNITDGEYQKRSRLDTSKVEESCETKDIGYIIDMIVSNIHQDPSLDGDLEKLISHMKLPQIATEFIDAFQPLTRDNFL